MSEETMLVRLQGGDVVRRPVASRVFVEFIDGSRVLAQEHPEVEEDEVAISTMGDPIPRIIRTR